MSPDEVKRHLDNSDAWRIATEECRQAFLLQARYSQYGRQETKNAFTWFHAGWEMQGNRS